jgi:hypothetical protein
MTQTPEFPTSEFWILNSEYQKRNTEETDATDSQIKKMKAMPLRHKGAKVHKAMETKNFSSCSFMPLCPGGKIQADEKEKACFCALLDSGFWILNSKYLKIKQ